jgi:hypothetical protein
MPDCYTCSICGQNHDGVPMSWGPDAPDMWAAMVSDEREKRGELGTDQCIIDERHFFIRGRIEISVADLVAPFAWLVWIEVSIRDFSAMSDLWTVEGRENKSLPYDGHLANELSIYERPTLGLAVKLCTRPVGNRPFVDITDDHEIRDEQQNGISPHRVQQIADKVLNR